MMDLVLIGPGIAGHSDSWRARTGARTAVPVTPDTLRLVDTPGRPEDIEAAHAAGLDAFHASPPLHRADFRLLTMDMDSTLITIECIDEIADMAGVKPQVAAVTAAAMRGELDFKGALRERVALLKGLPVSALHRVYEERLRLSPGAEILLQAARAAGWTTLLVSGGFTFFTDRLQTRLGLDHTLSNTLEIVDDTLTGRVLGDIVDGAAKAARLEQACRDLGCTPAQAVVIGDGANDLPMLRLAGLSVAFHAKPVVRRETSLCLNHCGLDALLHRFTD